MSEGEDGFEVTMTATTDDELSQERVAQIQVEEDELVLTCPEVTSMCVCVCV